MEEVLEKSNRKKSKFFIFLIVIVILLMIVGFFIFIRFNNKNTSSNKLSYNLQNSCYYTNKCPENTNCFYIDRYNYKTHQRELIYSECLKQCQNEDGNNCPEGSKCGLFPVRDVNPDNLNRTIDHLCLNEQKINESIKKSIIDNGIIIGKISRKQFHFNGDINEYQTKEYNFITTEKTLEVEMVLSSGGCMDLHIFDTKGRHIGENWGPPGSLDKPTIPNVEYHREPCGLTVIKLKDPLPDTYQVKVFALETYGDKENFDVLIGEVSEI